MNSSILLEPAGSVGGAAVADLEVTAMIPALGGSSREVFAEDA